MSKTNTRIGVIATVMVAAMVLVGGVPIVAAQSLPATYHGSVTVNGDSADQYSGVEVIAAVDTNDDGTYDTTTDTLAVDGDGNYGGPTISDSRLDVPDLDSVESGDDVGLFVDGDNFANGRQLADTDTVTFGSDNELDLSVSVSIDDGSDDGSDDDDGSTGGGSTTAEEEEESESDEETTVEDVVETVEETEPDTETEVDIDEVGETSEDGEGVTVDTGEEIESVNEITFDDEDVSGTVSVQEYSSQEVIEATEESIRQSITESVEEDVEQDVEEDVEQDVEEDVEQDVEEDAEQDVEEDVESDGDTATDGSGDGASDSGSSSVSVSVATVSDIEPDDTDASATVTMSADADEVDNPDNVAIYKEGEDGWNELPTEVEEVTDEEVTVSGNAESFSLFAVAEVEQTDTAAESDQPEETDETDETDETGTDDGGPSPTLIVIALLAIVTGAGAFFYLRGSDN